MRKALKPIIIILMITVIIVIGMFYANDQLNRIGNQISEKVLLNLVKKESNGLYELSFDRIDLDILGRTIKVYNAKLIPQIENLQDSGTVSNVYHVSVDSVDIKLRSVIKIYTENELVVEGVTVVNPQIRMTKINPEKKLLKFGRETGELYETISDYLDLLKIEYFKVIGGGLSHSPSQLSLNTIDFQVTEFIIDPSKKKRKVFYSEAINLGLSNQSIDLPDSIHVLSFDSFNLSTKDSILSFSNLKIQPRPGVDREKIFTQEGQNIYNILIPTLELKGINYLKAYEDNHLVIDQVNIPEPIINIRSASDADSSKKTSGNTIGRSLLALFDLVKVSKFEINNGALDLIVKTNNQQQFKSENISIALFNIRLDSNNYQINSRTTYFEDAKIKIHDYNYKLPDSLHLMSFNSLNINTMTSTLEVKNFVISPSRSKQDESITQYNFVIPSITLEGMDFKQALIDKQVFLSKMVFQNPSIEITASGKKHEADSSVVVTPKVLQGFMDNYFEQINASLIEVNNGRVEISNEFLINGISLKLRGLKIDTASSSWHSLADSIVFHADNLTLNRDNMVLNAQQIEAGKQLSNFEIGAVQYTDPKTGNAIRTQQLIISGVQLDSIIKSKIIQLEGIVVTAPVFNIREKIQKGGKKQSNWKLPEKPILLTLKDGSLNYTPSASTKINVSSFNTRISYLNTISLDYFQAGKLKIEIDDFAHSISADSLLLPANSRKLSIRNITSKALNNKSHLKINAKIPLLQFISFEKKTLLSSGKLVADSLKIIASSIDTYWIEQTINKANTKKTSASKKETNNDFSIDLGTIHLKIKNGLATLVNKNNEKSLWTHQNTSLTLKDFSYPSREKTDLLFSKGHLLEFDKLVGKIPNGDSLLIGRAYYSTITQKGELNNLQYANKKNNINSKIGTLKLENLNIIKLRDDNELKIGKVASEGISLKMILNNSDSASSFQSKKFLPFSQLTINQFKADDMNLELYHQKKGRSYHIREANLAFQKLRLDSAFDVKNLHHRVQSFSFSGKNFKEDLGKNYTVSIGDYNFSYPDAGLNLSSFNMENKYDRFDFSNHIDYQTDWFDLSLKSVRLSGINLDKLVNQNFEIQKIAINDGNFTIFRDLNIPLDSTKYVPLPQELLRKVKYPVTVDSISVTTNIKIYIVPADGTGLGYIAFENLKGGIKNITTRPNTSSLPMKLSAKGTLNGSGDFQAKVEFPLNSQKDFFSMKGSVGRMELTTLNDMLVPIAAVEVRSGTNDIMTFNFSGNNEYSKGTMSFQYDNLKINILDRQTYKSTGLNNNLRTFFANSFVVRGQNPNFFKLHEGGIFYKRDKSRSIFNFWAKSLLSGAVSSIGISNNDSAKEYEKIDNSD
ncbi:hypothetical protein GCM10011506_04230 [Marivirga lumbricoides]|uniref:DUF490 domain-containing protein n=1 Tax=Marivirga lumbricoides TaxID=1046115 RepID=A0ABQ1LGU7_9BACT|nr:hypothetical protein GCM10011506_04230 [Marivirga lumbricoides]